MNNRRLLTASIMVSLSIGACLPAVSQRVYTLEEIFSVAESNSATLRPFFTSEREARKEISVARSARLPEITAKLNLSFIGDGFTTKRNLSDYQRAPIPHLGTGIGIDISQPVYAGGAITASCELAELKSSAMRFATDFQRDNLRFRLAGYYLDLYKYANLRKVVTENIRQANLVLDEMRARYEQGVALRNDITRYELLLSNYELHLIKINNMLDIVNRDLAVTAGLPEGTVVMPDTTILSAALPLNGEEWWKREAQSNSPTIRLAQADVDISAKLEKIARSELLPKIGILAGWTIDGPILTEIPPINRNLSYWYVGLGVNYNISSLYKSNRSVEKSRIAARKAIEQLEARREDVSLAVRGDYIKYIEAYEDLKTHRKSVELAERNYRTIFTRYSADMALITDMLDAANSKLDAEQQLVNARINIIYSYYKLLFISGKI